MDGYILCTVFKLTNRTINDNTGSVIDKVSIEKQCSTKSKPSYADTMRQNEPVILVIPKQAQTAQVTQKAVMQLMDPLEIPVENMRSTGKGTVVLEGNSKQNLELIQKYATEKLGETYEVRLSQLKNPKILISGMTERFSNDVIISNLKRQNPELHESDMKVVSTFGKRALNAVVEIDGDGFNRIMSSNYKKLRIGWSRCPVKEYVDLLKCYKCQGFSHKSKDCTKKKACKKCAGEHDISDCKSKVIRCANCIDANDKLNLNLETNHIAGSQRCKVTERHMNIRRKRVQYKITE